MPLDTNNTTSTNGTTLPMQRFSDLTEAKKGWPGEPERIYPGFGSEGTLHGSGFGRADEERVEEQV